MRLWAPLVFATNFILSVLVLLVLMIVSSIQPSMYEVVLLVSLPLLALLSSLAVILVTSRILGPLTRTAWKAEDEGKLLLLLMGRDNTITPIVPRLTGSIMSFNVDGYRVYYVLHPHTVLSVPESRAKVVLAHKAHPATLPVDAVIAGVDIRYIKGYEHAGQYLDLEKERIDREQLKQKYAELLDVARKLQDADEEEEAKKLSRRVVSLLRELGFNADINSITINDIIKYAESNLKLIESIEKTRGEPLLEKLLLTVVKEHPEKVIAINNNAIRAVTTEEVEAILSTYNLPQFLADFEERAMVFLRELYGLGMPGLNMRLLLILFIGFIVLMVLMFAFQSGGFRLPFG